MNKRPALAALRAAFPYTIPIFAGFWFLAFAYGFYMTTLGFPAWYPWVMAMVIFGGSLEFVTISMLLSPFAPLSAFLVGFTVQARHLFYGLSMMDKYAGTGWKKPCLIFMMCDETFALNYSLSVPYNVDRGWFYFWISFLDYAYWWTGALGGGLLGNIISFNTKGLGFIMTTMFLVIFLEQLLKEKKHDTTIIGFLSSVAALLIFGKDSFIIPAMVLMVAVITILRKPIERRMMAEPLRSQS